MVQTGVQKMSFDSGIEGEYEDSHIINAVYSFFNNCDFISNNSNYNKNTFYDRTVSGRNPNFPILPIGLIPRLEYSRKHLNFISSQFNRPYIMLNLDLVERLSNNGITAHDFYPFGNIITTSTIHDDNLCNYNIEREIKIIKKFEPAWHIPCDYPVYTEDCDEGRKWFIDALVEDTLYFMDSVRDTSIGILPLVKGINETEWEMSTFPFKERGISHFAFYAEQYFGSKKGKNDNLMIEHIRCLVSTCDVDYLLLIGYQSSFRLQGFPPEVQAFAGKRWIKGSKLNSYTQEQARVEYLNWERHFHEQDTKRQSVLNLRDENILMEEC